MGFRTGHLGAVIPAGTAAGEILVWDGTEWVPAAQSTWRAARIKFYNAHLNGLTVGQMSSEYNSSAGAAAALPLNAYYGTKICDIAWRILGITAFVHFNVVPADITFTVVVNGVLSTLNTVVASNTACNSTWLATPIDVPSNPAWDWIGVQFNAAVPIVGNNYYEVDVFYEYLSPAPGGNPP